MSNVVFQFIKQQIFNVMDQSEERGEGHVCEFGILL